MNINFFRRCNLIVVLILTTILQLSARTYSQQITIQSASITIEQAFREIEKQSGYRFFYNELIIDKKQRITLDLQQASLTTALDILFKNLELNYTIIDKTINVTKKEYAPGLQKNTTINGRVTDAGTGMPLSGATIKVKGSQNSTQSDEKGIFRLGNVPDDAVLLISYVGYADKELTVPAGSAAITIALSSKHSDLDAVQVIAYGTTTIRKSTGNVGTVSAKDLEKQPVNNPLLGMEGRLAGVFITQSTGLPGTGVTIRIQGANSLNSGNDPLYVVDGVPFVSQLLTTLTSVLGSSGGAKVNGATNNGSGNPLTYLNPADIESISVLKDADATAIYGSRAANGAVLITTKKGKAGKTVASVNVQNGWGKVAKKIRLLNTPQYLMLRKEAKRNDNLSILSTDYDINGFWDTTRYTDWQKELIGGTSWYTDGQLAISGGSEATQFRIGAGYHRETTVFPGDFGYKKGSLSFNINHATLNQKFRLQFSGNYVTDDNRLNANDYTSTSMSLAPDAPALRDSAGNINWKTNAAGASTWSNPLATMLGSYRVKGNNLNSNLILSYRILKNLEVKSSFGYNRLEGSEISLLPLSIYAPETRVNNTRTSTFSNSTVSSWIIEPQVQYRENIWKGKLEVLIGTTINKRNSNRAAYLGRGFTSDEVMGDIKSAATVTVQSTVFSEYATTSAFGRISYNLADEYILNFTARRDGSSRFGSENRYQNFGSVAAGWLFSNSKYVKNNVRWLSFGKLRGSLGTTGNDQIGDYQYLNLFSSTGAGNPYQGTQGLLPAGISNAYIQWEKTKKLQGGLDLGFDEDKLLFTVNYFDNRSNNQLLPYPLPGATGTSSVLTNLPALVTNKGWEFTLTKKWFDKADFSWATSVNYTSYKNRLQKYPGLDKSTLNGTYFIGSSTSTKIGYNFLGVDPGTGVYLFKDRFGNATASPVAADRTYYYNTDPRFYGGLTNSISYKGFDLDLTFQFVKQNGTNNRFGNYAGGVGVFNVNQPTTVLDRWQNPGDKASVQRYSTGYGIYVGAVNAQTASNAGISDASYIRLKNASLSYRLPLSLLRKSGISNVRVYCQGQNLLTFTKFKGLDPETRSSTSLPPLRIITIGLNAEL